LRLEVSLSEMLRSIKSAVALIVLLMIKLTPSKAFSLNPNTLLIVNSPDLMQL
jgi:hypothetical protein